LGAWFTHLFDVGGTSRSISGFSPSVSMQVDKIDINAFINSETHERETLSRQPLKCCLRVKIIDNIRLALGVKQSLSDALLHVSHLIRAKSIHG
jgi:hypothetical protein